MKTYLDYGKKSRERIKKLLEMDGFEDIPSSYTDFLRLDHWVRKLIGTHLPLVLSDNYEHFMACLPGKTHAGQHVLIRKQIGGLTVSCGFWKWLEFLSHQITQNEVELIADFFSGKHNDFPRRFNKAYWLHVVHDFDGYLPIRISYVGEGVTFTGVPFPVAEIYGETPAVWLNEPLYIQIGHLSHVATIAAQFSEALGNTNRFIEVMFRALHNKEESDDVLLAIMIGGGIISTSNDLGAFVNGAPFKPSGTTGHCYYQQYNTQREALIALLNSDLGPYSTVLLDTYDHENGFKELQQLLSEGYPAPFAERPDSGDTLNMGIYDLTVLQDQGNKISVVFEDGYTPSRVLKAEVARRQSGLSPDRVLFGAGGAFIGPRSSLETAYKACYFHNGSTDKPEDIVETMKICLDDPSKQSLPGLINWFRNDATCIYILGCHDEPAPVGHIQEKSILYDGLTNPGKPYFNPDYDPSNLTKSPAILNGIERSVQSRQKLGANFTQQIEPNKNPIAMTPCLIEKRERIYNRVLHIMGEMK